MKKVLVILLLISVMALSFAAPAMAKDVVEEKAVTEVAYQEIAPFTEITRIYNRWCPCCMRLQFRVWGMVSMRWLTDWDYV